MKEFLNMCMANCNASVSCPMCIFACEEMGICCKTPPDDSVEFYCL